MRMKLQELRKAHGFTQVSMSQATNISRSHYSQIESGEKDPSLKVSLRIKRVLGYNGDDLFLNQKRPN